MRFFTNRLVLFIALLCILASCGNNAGTPATPADTLLKTGGLYFFKNRDSAYMIAKILVIDTAIFHVRIYQDKFPQKPGASINSANLTIAIGHAPVVKDGIQLSYKNLIKVEPVVDSELNGYRLYLEGKEPPPFELHQ